MAELSEQEIVRRSNLQQMRELGIDPYPAAEYPTNAFSTDIKENFEEGKEVCIAGRMMSRRVMGKASFIQLMDSKGRIQVYVTRDALADESQEDDEKKNLFYNRVFKKLLDLGDFVGVKGYEFRTQTGEISVHCTELTVLAKSLRPLPVVKTDSEGNVYDAFNDPELRFRQRYVDLIVNDGVKETFLKRTKVIKTLRECLDEAGYTEVETPILQSIPGGASARPFVTHHNTLDIDLYCRIATELYLKRLIVGGFEGVYEIGKNFRNEGMDKNHNPEFTCMELYVQYKDYNWMMSFTEKVLERICVAVNGKPETEIDGKVISFKAPFRRLPILEAIKEKTGYDLEGMSEDELRETAKKCGVEVDIRRDLRGHLHPAHLHHRLSRGDVAPDEDAPFEARTHGALRADGQRQGAGQRLLRAQRPHRPGGALQGADASGRQGRRRGDDYRSGLPARPAVRHAPHFGHRHRHRPSGDAHDGKALHPGGALLPADEATLQKHR